MVDSTVKNKTRDWKCINDLSRFKCWLVCPCWKLSLLHHSVEKWCLSLLAAIENLYSEAIDSNIYITSICIFAFLLVSCCCRVISPMAFTAWVIAAQFSAHEQRRHILPRGSAPFRKCGSFFSPTRFLHVT